MILNFADTVREMRFRRPEIQAIRFYSLCATFRKRFLFLGAFKFMLAQKTGMSCEKSGDRIDRKA